MFTWSLILGACAWVSLLLLILHDATKNDSEGSAILIAGNKVVTLVRWAVLKARELQKARRLRFSQATVSKPPANLKTAVETSSSSLKPVRQDAQHLIEQTRLIEQTLDLIEHTLAAAPPKTEHPLAPLPNIEQAPAASPPEIEQVLAAPPPKTEHTLAPPPKTEQTPAALPPTIERATAAPPPRKWWSKDTRVSKTAEELELTITETVMAAPGCEAFVGVIIQRTTPKSPQDANWELRGIKFGRTDRKIAREALTPIVERMQREFRLPERSTKSPFARPKTAADARPITARGGSASASVHPP